MTLCLCGCGTPTRIAKNVDRANGWETGVPISYVHGHNMRKPEPTVKYEVRDCGHTSPCWVWHNNYTNGYGTIWVDGRQQRAHRFMYEKERGPIPEGLEIDHLCFNRACVNPDHLEPVTQYVNNLRRRSLKLNPERVAEIKALVREGWRRCDVADAYGVSRPTITNIMRGITWKEVA